MTSTKNAAKPTTPTAVSWKPEAGASVTGAVKEIRWLDGKFGIYPLVVLDTEGFPSEAEFPAGVAIHGSPSVLHRELKSLAPQRGEVITVTYRGLVEPQNGGNAYHGFTVSGDTDRPFNWS